MLKQPQKNTEGEGSHRGVKEKIPKAQGKGHRGRICGGPKGLVLGVPTSGDVCLLL